MKTFQGSKQGRLGWTAGLVIGLTWGTVVAAPPQYPETAAEIERALSAQGKAQPSPQPRGGPSPGGTGVGKLRGPAGIVDDPTPLPAVAPLDYPTLIRDHPKVAALIHFDTNSARIHREAYPLLNAYVNALKSVALADAVLVIAGHTDAIGSDDKNFALSQERAEAVKDYLIKRGITPDRLIAKGYGGAHPVASNAVETGRELNRRSEFIRIDVSIAADR